MSPASISNLIVLSALTVSQLLRSISALPVATYKCTNSTTTSAKTYSVTGFSLHSSSSCYKQIGSYYGAPGVPVLPSRTPSPTITATTSSTTSQPVSEVLAEWSSAYEAASYVTILPTTTTSMTEQGIQTTYPNRSQPISKILAEWSSAYEAVSYVTYLPTTTTTTPQLSVETESSPSTSLSYLYNMTSAHTTTTGASQTTVAMITYSQPVSQILAAWTSAYQAALETTMSDGYVYAVGSDPARI